MPSESRHETSKASPARTRPSSTVEDTFDREILAEVAGPEVEPVRCFPPREVLAGIDARRADPAAVAAEMALAVPVEAVEAEEGGLDGGFRTARAEGGARDGHRPGLPDEQCDDFYHHPRVTFPGMPLGSQAAAPSP